jgi:glycosyltransferase involved in cell wall biosynthesis
MRMKIAQIAPLYESVPPRRYGGTERIVSYLTEELVRRGHDVTLFASGDSTTAAKLVPCCQQALRLNTQVQDVLPYQIIQLEQVRQQIDRFDVLHFHTDLMHFPLIRDLPDRTVTTLMGGWICPIWRRSIASSVISRWCPFPKRSACQCRPSPG